MSKICFFTGSLNQGGVERDISLLANSFVRRGHEVYIVLVFSNEIFFKIDHSIKIIDFSKFNKNRSLQSIINISKESRKLQRQMNFDYVICNMIGLNCLLTHSLRKENCKLILRVASDPKSWTFKNKICSNIFYPKADLIITQTDYQVSCFRKPIQKLCHTIPNICDFSQSKTIKNNFSSKQITYIGRLNVSIKRIDLLLKGFKYFLEQNDNNRDYVLSLYGQFSTQDQSELVINNLIQELKLENNVNIKGSTDDVQKALSESFCYLFASPHEGMPNSILEAQLFGIPVISSNFQGVKEIINNEVDGLIYQFGNIEEISSCLLRLINDQNMYQTISKNGINNRKRYSEEVVVKGWENVLNIKE